MKIWQRIIAVLGAAAIIASCFAGQQPKWEKKVSAATRKTEEKLGAAAGKTSEKLNAAAGKSSHKVGTYSNKESKGFNNGVHERTTGQKPVKRRRRHRVRHHSKKTT